MDRLLGSKDCAVLLMLSVLGCIVSDASAANKSESLRHQDTNVVMISIDTMRHDHLGFYGYARSTSENMDALAGQSVVFDNFVSQAVLTPVSQMSIFTSQYPRVNGMVSFQPEIELITAKTLPDILKAYGYTNAAFVSSPEFMDLRYVNNQSGADNKQKLFSKSFDVYVPAAGEFRTTPEEALEWVRTHKDEKFFLWLPVGTVHWPYSFSVPTPYRTMFDPKDYVPFYYDVVGENKRMKATGAVDANVLSYIYKGRFYGITGKPYQLSDADTSYIVGRYDAGILYTDIFVGRLLKLLDSLDLSRKTLVVIYSTHGEDLGEHGYFGHYDLYDTETKNALLMRFPGNAYGGRRSVPQVQGIDIVPTLLDFLGIPIPHEAQGVSFLSDVVGGPPRRDAEFAYVTRIPLFEYVLYKGRRLFNVTTRKSEVLSSYMDLLDKNLGGFDPQMPPYDIAIRTNDWKLILRNHVALLEKLSWWRFVSGDKVPIEELELYDLKTDPKEQKNVAAEHPEVVARLRQKLIEWDASLGSRVRDSKSGKERVLIPYP